MSPNLHPLRKCLAVAASLLLWISAFASDKRPEADSLMSRAAELSSLDHNDSRPFHLYVNFMLAGMVSGSTDGRYMWTSVPNQHWRQEIKFADYSQVAIGEHGKIWLKRTTDFQPKPVTWLSTLLGNYARLKLLSDEKVTRVYNDSHTRCVEGIPLKCAVLLTTND